MFDLGGVIMRHDNLRLYRQIAGRCTTPDVALALYRIAADRAYVTGTRPISHLHERLCKEAGYQGDWDCFIADWSCHFAVDFSMLAFVEALATRRRVLLFSNTNREHWEHLVAATDGRLGRIEAYLSHELGLMKPDPAAFAAVARRAGLDPASTLFIDDIEANIAGARQAGFLALRFTDEAALRRELGEPVGVVR
jgi:FMN phosphatase YigB (HAD superfamily)